MAKLRVYELARELSMENKELLEKVKEMDIEVKSHMSSLDGDTVSLIKKNLFGTKDPEEVVEDKRIKPNVIRRRRKRVVAEPVEQKASESDEFEDKSDEIEDKKEADTIPAPSKEEPEVTEPATEETEPVLEKPDTEEEEAVLAPPPAEKPKKVKTKAKKPKTTKTDKKEKADKTEKKAADKTVETEEIEQPETKGDTEIPEAIKAEQPETATKEAKEKPAAKVKPKRKGKKSTPAKVISLPKEPVEPEKKAKPEPSKRGKAKPKKSAATEKKKSQVIKPTQFKPQTPEKEDPAGKKKGRKKRGAGDSDFDAIKKPKMKPAPKRKEVVEGSALYDKGFGRSRKGRKKHRSQRITGGQKTQITTPKAIKRRFKVDDTIVLADLGKRMGIKANELIAKLMGMGMMVTVNQTIDFDTACLVATEFDFELERASFEEDAIIKAEVDDPANLRPRPPVVTIMGHVDHGKTSLLDVIRRSKITEFEAGGITQHIGAYHVPHENGDIIFLDTPGHEAFTAMRSRGAQVTDIVVLVVAADDGVMPQTVEAIDHAKAADVPIIVAVNKVDKPDAEPERIKRELAEKGLAPEDWGGDTIFVNVSAKEQTGIDDLLEMILIQTEVLELKANPAKLATGHIIESRLDTGRGAVATILVKDGTLRVGDSVVCGMYYGKLRIMYDDRGNQIKEAGPAIPVEIVGLSGVPMAGDELAVLSAEKDAKQVSEHRLQKQRSKELARTSRLSLEKLYEKLMEGEVKDLNLIIKADVQGSIEALKDSLTKLSIDEVKIGIIHSAVGPIHESDISLAAVSNAIILGFNVRPSAKVAMLAEEENVDIRYYDIIYNAIKEIKNAVFGMMDAKFEEKVQGEAEVRETFHVPSIGTIAGCYVTNGKIMRGGQVRLIRDGIVIYDGKIATLRRFKDDVKEVAQNYECGIHIENYNDIKLGDIMECYHLVEVKPTMPV